LYLVSDDDRIVQVASWHRNGDTKDFAWDLKRIAARIPDVDIPVAVVADGAPWIWALAKKHFPDARQVLDYYHCSEHVHAVANEQYPDPICARLEEVGKLNPGHAGGPSTPAGVLPLRTDGSHTAVGPQGASLIEAWRGCDRPSTPAFWAVVGDPASPEQRGRSSG
jgi:hypothetical protein